MTGQQGAYNKVASGDIMGAIHDVVTWAKNRFESLPTWTQNFIRLEVKPEVSILEGLMPSAIKTVIAGGFSTGSFVAAGKGIMENLVSQNVSSYTMQSVMANLNMAIATDPEAQQALADGGLKSEPVAFSDPNPVIDPIPEKEEPVEGMLPDNVAAHTATPVE